MSKDISACLSHATDEWRTPSKLYNHFINIGCIDLFPFGSSENQFDKDYTNSQLFCNPPFSKLKLVIPYLIKQAELGNRIYLLMPSRTDTSYFHQLLDYHHCFIYFFPKRLRFNDSKQAPFPSMLVYIDKKIILPLFSKFELIDLLD